MYKKTVDGFAGEVKIALIEEQALLEVCSDIQLEALFKAHFSTEVINTWTAYLTRFCLILQTH
jgi:hypothetical protein